MNKVKATLAASAMLMTALGTASPALAYLHPGSTTQHPSTGGTWEYGFWNAKVRSYYTVSKSHGSSVILNGDLARSACTASGQKSVAEKYAVNTPGATDEYYYRTC
jgi:lactococcin 972-like bacteriocin